MTRNPSHIQMAFMAARGYPDPDIFFRIIFPDGTVVEAIAGKDHLTKAKLKARLIDQCIMQTGKEPPEGWTYEYIEVFG